MLELGSSGSVRGVLSNEHPYRHPASIRDVAQKSQMRKKRPFQDVATEALVPLAGISVLLQAKRMCDPDHRQGFILVIFGSIGR